MFISVYSCVVLRLWRWNCLVPDFLGLVLERLSTCGRPRFQLFYCPLLSDTASADPWPLLAQTKLPEVFSGKSTELAQQLGTKGLVIAYVDIACPEAKTAVRGLPEIRRVLGKHGVRTILINADEPVDFVQEHYAPLQSAADIFLHDSDGCAGDAWDIASVPTIFLFDGNGAMAYRGTAEWAKLALAAEKSLALPRGAIHFTVQGTGRG